MFALVCLALSCPAMESGTRLLFSQIRGRRERYWHIPTAFEEPRPLKIEAINGKGCLHVEAMLGGGGDGVTCEDDGNGFARAQLVEDAIPLVGPDGTPVGRFAIAQVEEKELKVFVAGSDVEGFNGLLGRFAADEEKGFEIVFRQALGGEAATDVEKHGVAPFAPGLSEEFGHDEPPTLRNAGADNLSELSPGQAAAKLFVKARQASRGEGLAPLLSFQQFAAGGNLVAQLAAQGRQCSDFALADFCHSCL